jgi:plasmid maintenance system antidote protein VapI
MTPIEYLDAAKVALDAQTNYRLAKALDLPEPRICEVYQGKGRLSDEAIAKLALALGLPIGEVLADLRTQDAKTDKAREFWRSFLGRMRSAASIFALVTLGAFCAQEPSQYEAAGGLFNRRRMS